MVELATSEPDCGSVKAKAEMASPDRVLGQPVRFLGIRAEEGNRAGAEPLHGKGKVGEAVMAGQSFPDQAQAAHIKFAVRRSRECCRKPAFPSAVTRCLQAASVGVINIGEMGVRPVFQFLGRGPGACLQKTASVEIGHLECTSIILGPLTESILVSGDRPACSGMLPP